MRKKKRHSSKAGETAPIKSGRGNRTNHPPNRGQFKKGTDLKRHTSGRLKKDRIKLGVMLTNFLTEEGRAMISVQEPGKPEIKIVKAKALAKQIWARALAGDYQFSQYLVDRILGKAIQPIDLAPGEGDSDTKVMIEIIRTKSPMASKPAEKKP